MSGDLYYSCSSRAEEVRGSPTLNLNHQQLHNATSSQVLQDGHLPSGTYATDLRKKNESVSGSPIYYLLKDKADNDFCSRPSTSRYPKWKLVPKKVIQQATAEFNEFVHFHPSSKVVSLSSMNISNVQFRPGYLTVFTDASLPIDPVNGGLGFSFLMEMVKFLKLSLRRGPLRRLLRLKRWLFMTVKSWWISSMLMDREGVAT
ncbi:hypothetical protein NE237_002382 [Protea cynaroides]|uniref:Uncharacterized protein n=1 Tax=Protea cynaroides TaxID=273540 RepID=A0A9Q0KV49_9MAGN|nr:hypothetical protein NE237_002382 [Protea cynaroides]